MYLQVEKQVESLIVIKRSKFIANLVPIESQEDAEKYLGIIKKKYSDATHNCYAYIADERGNLARFSDDGEPQGTAGLPILEKLKKSNLSKTLAVVTRYFGGIKLGSAGLVGAYTDAVAGAIEIAKINAYYMSQTFEIQSDYTNSKIINDCLTKFCAKILEISYQHNVSFKVAVKQEQYEEIYTKLIDLTRGQIDIVLRQMQYLPF